MKKLSRSIILCIVGMVILLAVGGCARTTSKGLRPSEAARQALASAAKTAQEVGPWEAREQLTAEINSLRTDLLDKYGSELRNVDSIFGDVTDTQINDTLNEYWMLAFASLDGRAAMEVWYEYVTYAASNGGARFAPAIIAGADAPGQEGNGLLQLAAGRFTLDGELFPRNEARAVVYFLRAWSAGVAVAADDLAQHYNRQGEFGNAYLWALRCTLPCVRAEGVRLDTLRSRLTTAEIARIEAEAAKGQKGANKGPWS